VKEILSVQGMLAPKSFFVAATVPVIDNYVLNDIMENNFARGNFKKVPVLIGSTPNETNLFTCAHFHDSATIAQVQEFFATLYNNNTIINKIPDIYGPISTYNNPLDYLNIVCSDSWAHCGSRRIAAQFTTYNVPSYLYTYNHFIPGMQPCVGVLHTAELAMIFPSYVSIFFPNYNLTAEEQRLSTNMMLY
jgi:carboxylesterase type B